MELDEFKSAVNVWLDAHTGELASTFEGIGTLDEQMAQLRKVRQLAYDAGFMRMGWPERVGGLGDPTCCAPTWVRRSLRAISSSPGSTPCRRFWRRP